MNLAYQPAFVIFNKTLVRLNRNEITKNIIGMFSVFS